jgi:hypothetical protein
MLCSPQMLHTTRPEHAFLFLYYPHTVKRKLNTVKVLNILLKASITLLWLQVLFIFPTGNT